MHGIGAVVHILERSEMHFYSENTFSLARLSFARSTVYMCLYLKATAVLIQNVWCLFFHIVKVHARNKSVSGFTLCVLYLIYAKCNKYSLHDIEYKSSVCKHVHFMLRASQYVCALCTLCIEMNLYV